MEAATPLFLLLLSIVLIIAIALGTADRTSDAKDKTGGSAAKTFPATSAIISYVIAGIIGLIGAGTMLWRRMSTDAAGGTRPTWAKVLRDAVGPAVARVAGDLLGHAAWTALLIVTIIATVFTIGIATPTSSLAWIAYAAIGILFLITLFTSPLVSDISADGVIGSMLAGLRSLATSRLIVGSVVVAAIAVGILALGTLYPLIGWGVLGAIIMLGLYYWHRQAFAEPSPTAKPSSDDADKAGDDDAEAAETTAADAAETTAESVWSWITGLFADVIAEITLPADKLKRYRERTVQGSSGKGANGDDSEDSKDDQDTIALAKREAQKSLISEYTLVLATLGASGGLIALAVALPRIWRSLPSLRLAGSMGTELLDGPVPLSTYAAMEVPGGSNAWRAPTDIAGLPKGAVIGGMGTSHYTIAWWQFMNTRNHAAAIPVLELGPVGQMLIGPGATTATFALTSPAPQGMVYKIPLDIVPQRWQHIALRASGNRTDVFVDGKLAGSSLHAPAAVRAGDVLTLPGAPPQKTEGGIAKLTYSASAEPFSAIVLAAHSPPAETQ